MIIVFYINIKKFSIDLLVNVLIQALAFNYNLTYVPEVCET